MNSYKILVSFVFINLLILKFPIVIVGKLKGVCSCYIYIYIYITPKLDILVVHDIGTTCHKVSLFYVDHKNAIFLTMHCMFLFYFHAFKFKKDIYSKILINWRISKKKLKFKD